LPRALFLKVISGDGFADGIDEGFEPEPRCKPIPSTPASSASFSTFSTRSNPTPASSVPDSCLVSTQLLPHQYPTPASSVPDFCLISTRLLPHQYPTPASSVPDSCLISFLQCLKRSNIALNGKCVTPEEILKAVPGEPENFHKKRLFLTSLNNLSTQCTTLVAALKLQPYTNGP